MVKKNGTPFKTAGGQDAIVYDFEGGGDYPWIGAYNNGHSWVPVAWTSFGKFPSINENMLTTKLDLLLFEQGQIGN